MKIVIENLSDGETIPHKTLLVRGRVDNLDSSLLEGKQYFNILYVIHSTVESRFKKACTL